MENDSNQKTVGILGGMGPEAGCLFSHQLVRLTPVGADQDHLKVILFNQSKIPDRTAHLLGDGESPVPHLKEAARNLQSWGADLIAIPCNTAHCFWNEIEESVSIPVLNMIEVAAECVALAMGRSGGSQVGILATRGTIRVGLYQEALKKRGLDVVLPSDHKQDKVQRAIYSIKASQDRDGVADALNGTVAELQGSGAQAVILGCTELSLCADRLLRDLPIFDSLELLARATLLQSGVRPLQMRPTSKPGPAWAASGPAHHPPS